VLPPATRREIEALSARWLARDALAERLGPAARARYRPGVRALLVGPSGTGKTLAVGWLATRLGLPLYRVDLASITSKYIGETEKNLAQLFARAEHAEGVLLFDEADSLFGKRTDVKEANDRFANAQTNYLLQRIESFEGIAILTSNSRARFDSAFTRRLDAVIEFPPPGPEERRALWVAHLGGAHTLSTVELNRIAAACDLAGGHIRNATLAAAVAARAHARAIAYADVAAGIAAEYRKLGKSPPSGIAAEPTT
jgi:SpoVK/Ycf46/Vps4 family AAA+-type ATPase